MIVANVRTKRGDRLGNWRFVALPRIGEAVSFSEEDDGAATVVEVIHLPEAVEDRDAQPNVTIVVSLQSI